MMTRQRLKMRVATLGWAALAVAVWAVPTRADFISEGAISEGTVSFVSVIPTGPFPPGTGPFSPGPFLPPFSFLSSGVNPTGSANSALEFDISSISTIPQGAVINSAILSLHIAGSQARNPSSGIRQSVFGYADADGVVMLSDFRKPVTFLGSTGPLPADAFPGSLNIPVSFDATNFMQSLVDSRTGFVGFLLGAGSTGVADWSSGSVDPARRPNLAITFSPVPEPPGARLMGLGLVGLLAVAWRRSRLAVA